VVITVIIPNVSGLIERVEKEITKGVNIFRKTEGSEARIVSLPVVSEEIGFSVDAFTTTWRKLQALELLVCDKTGRTFPSSSKPAAVVFDVCILNRYCH
jgi:hypothetical protein